MSRRRTHRQTCTRTGCRAYRDIEYTARREVADVKPDWVCRKHDKPNEYLGADNREQTTVLELHPRYRTDMHGQQVLLGHFWGPEGAPDKAHHGIVSGPGFWADAKNFPPGARLIVTARIELPDQPTA
ncbi:hypothetical protein ACJWDR_37690 [Streptomyces tauricus]|uniref:hypothetical protein n=1 Tax=Streptomyces tauricus TaxID=68274 RepID=UPI00387F0892